MNISYRGSGHFVLSRLSEGSATLAELREEAGIRGNRAKKLGFLMSALFRHGLVSHEQGFGYEITRYGLEALAILNSGQDFTVVQPGARVFGRARANHFTREERPMRAEHASEEAYRLADDMAVRG
ncbi:hypothetical protein [Phenylobacterium kunshanense]|uniref:Uncharacterized protein n=1 Tax=Phenylobacterium kunshanense TaxID=1445034 RepID=A0A328BQ25_9CAUL|nr:hypothetical protein [Phenylobacterium kunshanense]RAK68775.1 hypothetical protein DJ019_01830 [Phenylobacterium kunshanense]